MVRATRDGALLPFDSLPWTFVWTFVSIGLLIGPMRFGSIVRNSCPFIRASLPIDLSIRLCFFDSSFVRPPFGFYVILLPTVLLRLSIRPSVCQSIYLAIYLFLFLS